MPTYCGVCSSLKHILVSNTKPSTSPVLIMWGPMHFPAVISLVFTLFSQGQGPARQQSSGSTRQAAVRPRTQLDLTALEELLSHYFTGGIAPATAGTYTSAKRRFSEFCLQIGVPPVPAAQHTVALFISYLAQSGLRSTSIQTYMAAIRHMHIEAGLDPPAREHWHQVNYVLRGIKRAQSTTPRRTRLPVTAEIMRAFRWRHAV